MFDEKLAASAKMVPTEIIGPNKKFVGIGYACITISDAEYTAFPPAKIEKNQKSSFRKYAYRLTIIAGSLVVTGVTVWETIRTNQINEAIAHSSVARYCGSLTVMQKMADDMFYFLGDSHAPERDIVAHCSDTRAKRNPFPQPF